MRVLIVDDNPADAELVRLHLRSRDDIHFDFAINFDDVETKYAFEKYDAVLTDFNLPGRDGFDIIEFLRSHESALPIIVVSGAIGEERAVEVLKRGATDYVLKENLHKLPLAFARAIEENNLRKEQSASQSRLAESESRYRSLIENMKEAVILTDSEGIFLFMNHQFCELTGYHQDELIGNCGYDLLIPEDFRAILRNKVQERRTGKSGSYEAVMLNKKGLPLSVSISASPVFEQGQFVGVMSVISDLTHQKKQSTLLLQLFQGLSVTSGSKFFSDVTTFFIRAFGVKYAIISLYNPGEDSAQTISFRENEKEIDNITYKLEGTPCEITVAASRCFYGNNVADEFPYDTWLRTASVQSYDGRLVTDSDNQIVGIIVLMHDRAMEDEDTRNFVLDLISARVGQEIVRFQTQEKLEKSETRFRMLVENSVDLNCILDDKGYFHYASPNFERILGYTEEELRNIVSFDLFQEKDQQQAREVSAKIMRNPGETYDVTHKYLTKHRGYRIFHTKGRSVKQEDGRVLHVFNSTDITEKIKLEKELRKSYEVLNLVNALVVVVNKSSEITYLSPSCETMLGFSREELLGKQWWTKTTGSYESAQDEREKVIRILTSGRLDTQSYYERKMFRKSGSPIWMGWEKSMSPDGSLIAVGYNITERKNAENALIRSEEKFRKIFESINDVYYQTDKNAIITMVSPSVEMTTGFSPSEVIGQPIVFFFEDAADRDVSRELLLKENRISNYETTIIGKDKQAIYVAANVSVRLDEQGAFAGTQGVFRDITQKKKSELERERLMKELSDRYNEMMQFNYIVSHNLRAPIAQLLGLTSVLKYNLEEEEKQKVLDSLATSTRSLDELLKDLNTILSARSTISQRVEEVDLAEIAESVRNSLTLQLKESAAGFSVHIHPAIRSVRSIKSYLQSIIYNLVSNAIKYRAAGRLPFITMNVTPEVDSICIEIADNGIGIDMKLHKDQIFKLYQRFDKSTEGKGLGLYMTKTQVEALGGKIEIQSEKNTGTKFVIRLSNLQKTNTP